MIEVIITMTSRPFGRDKEYTIFNIDEKKFKNVKEVKKWIKDQYGACKRSKMYIDHGDNSRHIGYIFHFIGSDWSHAPVEKWYQRDWVEIREVTYGYVSL